MAPEIKCYDRNALTMLKVNDSLLSKVTRIYTSVRSSPRVFIRNSGVMTIV